MIDVLLLDELVDFVTTIVSDYRVEDDKGKQWPLTVVKGFLPPKRTDEIEDYEKYCVLVRFDDGETDWNVAEEQTKAINRTIIAVRTASMDVQKGSRNTLNLMNLIQRRIYSNPILAKKYRATFPMKWKAPAGDSLPIWQGEMTIPWIVPMVQEIFEIGGDLYA